LGIKFCGDVGAMLYGIERDPRAKMGY